LEKVPHLEQHTKSVLQYETLERHERSEKETPPQSRFVLRF